MVDAHGGCVKTGEAQQMTVDFSGFLWLVTLAIWTLIVQLSGGISFPLSGSRLGLEYQRDQNWITCTQKVILDYVSWNIYVKSSGNLEKSLGSYGGNLNEQSVGSSTCFSRPENFSPRLLCYLILLSNRCATVSNFNITSYRNRAFLKSRDPEFAKNKMAEGTRKKTGSVSKQTEKDVNKCIFCSIEISSKTQAITCDICKHWVCLKCSMIPKAVYEVLISCENHDMDWCCKVCKASKVDLKTIGITLHELKTSSESRLTKVEDKLLEIEGNVRSVVREEIKEVKSDLVTTVNDNIAEKVEALVEARLREHDDRKSRSFNLVVFHLPISKAEEPLERKEHDIKLLKELISIWCPDKGDLQLRTCFRLKNRKKPSPGNLPLKVILASKDQRRSFLVNSKKITDIEDEDLKKVIISKDLTPEQRTQSRKSVQEKKQREEDGENVVLRFGEVTESTDSTPEDAFREGE